MSDAPTQRLGAPEPEPQQPGDRNRRLLIALIVIGAVLVVAVVVALLVAFVFTGKPVAVATTSPTPTATTPSPTPSATPAPTPTPTPAATSGGGGGGGSGQPTGGEFTVFQPVTSVRCEAPAPNFTPPPIPIQITWKTIRTDSVWFVQGTSDAADSGFMQLPVSGSQSSFPSEIDFPCGQASATYDLTLVGSDGHHVTKVWTVTNTGDRF